MDKELVESNNAVCLLAAIKCPTVKKIQASSHSGAHSHMQKPKEHSER